MSDPEPNKTFTIRHKETKELFRASSGKTSWKATGHAKNAFNLSVAYGRSAERYGLEVIREQKSWGVDEHGPKFDQQGVWEIVELKSETDELFGQSLLLLKEVFERERNVSWSLAERIEKFLIENSVEINYED